MIRTIFFDYDGVLTTDKSGSLTTFRYLSQACGIAASRISAAFGPYAEDLFTGRVSHAEIWHPACQALGEILDIRLLAGAFDSTPMNPGMFSLAQRLKTSHAMGIITDNNKERMDHLRKHQGLNALFNPIVVSAEFGSGKHGQEIFLHALSLAGVAPDECVFIDNSEANLGVARAVGMHAIFHDDEKNDLGVLMSELALLGVCLNDY